MFNNAGHRKGLAIYADPCYRLVSHVKNENYQISTCTSQSLVVTNVYRSNGASQDFEHDLKGIIEQVSVCHVIQGDFNYCLKENDNHRIVSLLKSHNYTNLTSQTENHIKSTHILGCALDHTWFRPGSSNEKVISYNVNTCVYSDHDSQSLVIEV